MLIDCDTCVARGPACGDCVVSALLGLPGVDGVTSAPAGARPATAALPAGGIELDGAEIRALGVLAEGGLVPPLRLLPPVDRAAV